MTAKISNEKVVTIPAKHLMLSGILGLSAVPVGGVVFAHGSGSGRLSPRNNYVARVLQSRGIITLLMDLLSESEEWDRRKVFDIDLLSERLLFGLLWLKELPEMKGLQMGFFGASTGAAAAIQASVNQPDDVAAIVSRGGRPDLAVNYLAQVKAPTLLIVGGRDHQVAALNTMAFAELNCEKSMITIPGATHLFEEPGTLHMAAEHATNWFLKYLGEEEKRYTALKKDDKRASYEHFRISRR